MLKKPLDPRFTPEARAFSEAVLDVVRKHSRLCMDVSKVLAADLVRVGVAHGQMPDNTIIIACAGLLAMHRDTSNQTTEAILENLAKVMKGIRWSTDPNEDLSDYTGGDTKWFTSS